VQSVMILALCFLWVAALLDVQRHMRTGVTSHKILVLIAISISVLAVFLIVATDALFIENRGEPFRPWSDWGVRLGS
jgi:amino acid transporter